MVGPEDVEEWHRVRGLKPPKTADHWQKEIKQKSTRIFISYHRLNHILESHELTIRKRWAKKTNLQRVHILTKAWPGKNAMARTHRLDLEALRMFHTADDRQRGKHNKPQYDAKCRDHFLLPHINLEDLTKPRSLPLLLHARGRNHPSAFAGADSEDHWFAIENGFIKAAYLFKHTMILNGVDSTNPEDYGKLVPFDDDHHHDDHDDHVSDALECVYKKQFAPTEGILVLEAQDRLLSFLVAVSEEILHDIDPASLTDTSKFPVQPFVPELELHVQQADLKSQATDGFESLAVMAAEAPYRVPAQLDLERVRSLLAARLSAAEDHMHALREDPSYFAEQLRECDHHSPPKEAWCCIIHNVVWEAYHGLFLFAELLRQLDELQALQAKHKDDISPTRDLPAEYHRGLILFRFFVRVPALSWLANTLGAAAPWSANLRHLFTYVPNESNPASGTLVPKPNTKNRNASKTESKLAWLLTTLWENQKPLKQAGIPLVADELQRLLVSEPALISGRVAALIGDISILAQCIQQIDLYHPWARSFEVDLENMQLDIKTEQVRRLWPWITVTEALHHDKMKLEAALLGDPSGKRFFYPVEKRRTRENVQALRTAEANLDAFWAAVDKLMVAEKSALKGTTAEPFLHLHEKVLQRTPEWVDLATSRPTRAEAPITTASNDLVNPLANLHLGPSSISTPSAKADVLRSAAAVAKEKVKTRGVAKPDMMSSSSDDSTTSSNVAKPVENPKPTTSFKVDARSLKVFRTLFFNPSVTSSPAEVAWTDFLHALASTGFVAEKLYGSVWQFRPAKGLDGIERPIQFHEPHPAKKLRFVVARRFGRRLFRNYGWTGDMFVLAK